VTDDSVEVMSEYERTQLTQCHKMLIEKGVDPTLEISARGGVKWSVLEDLLWLGTKASSSEVTGG
jgi:hypothetical protein